MNTSRRYRLLNPTQLFCQNLGTDSSTVQLILIPTLLSSLPLENFLSRKFSRVGQIPPLFSLFSFPLCCQAYLWRISCQGNSREWDRFLHCSAYSHSHSVVKPTFGEFPVKEILESGTDSSTVQLILIPTLLSSLPLENFLSRKFSRVGQIPPLFSLFSFPLVFLAPIHAHSPCILSRRVGFFM